MKFIRFTRVGWVVMLALAVALGGAQAGARAAEEATVKHVDAKGAAELLAKNKEVEVLDIRTPDEYKGGHIASAKNIDFRAKDFEASLGKLDRSKTYLVHCASGGRSTRSLEVFGKLGFKSVVHLDGGFNGWKKAELPVEK